MWILLAFLWSIGDAKSLSLDIPDQLVTWLEGNDELLASCRTKMDERISVDNRVVLLEVGNCSQMDHPSGHIPHGQFDSDGRLEGKGELVITWVKGLDREEEKPDMEGEEVCYSVQPGLVVRSIKSTWHRGKPQRKTELRLKNGQFMLGWVEEGCLHGPVFLLSDNRRLLFSGFFHNGRPLGWLAAASPSLSAGHGLLLLKMEDGRHEEAVYLDHERACRGTYKEGKLLGCVFIDLKSSSDTCLALPYTVHEKDATERNVTLPFHVKINSAGRVMVALKDILLFNRVPKTGSLGILNLLESLSKVNNFTITSHATHADQSIENFTDDFMMNQNLAELISKSEVATVWNRHYNHLDAEEHGLPPFLHINMVRHPVERIISDFYYRRSGAYVVERKLDYPEEPWPDSAFLRRDFTSCVLEGDPECQWQEGKGHSGQEVGHKRQMSQFCGQESWCNNFNSERAMMTAMRRVEEQYVVVGVTELFEETLEVLEHLLPSFFKGALQLYRKRGKIKINSNHVKPFVSNEIRDIITRNNSKEVLFYNFCRERLKRQLEQIRGEKQKMCD